MAATPRDDELVFADGFGEDPDDEGDRSGGAIMVHEEPPAQPWEAPLPRRTRPPPRLLPAEDRAPPPAPAPKRTPEMMNTVHEVEPFEGLLEEHELESVRYSKLEEYLAVQVGLRMSCRTLPLTIAMWLSFVLLIFNHGQAKTSFDTALFIDTTIRDAVAPGAGVHGQDLSLDTIVEHDDVMAWIEKALTPVLMIQGLREGMALDNQQLIGYMRLRQTRGDGPVECKHLSKSLKTYYTGMCHPWQGTGLDFGDANVSRYEFSWKPDENNFYDAWIQIGRGMELCEHIFRSLEESHWVDYSTNELVVEAAFLAPENHVYSHMRIGFTFNREGYIERELKIKPLRGDVYPNWAFIVLDISWVIILCVLLFDLLSAMANDNAEGILKLYFTDPFVWLDWIAFIWGLTLGLLFYFLLVTQLDQLFDLIANLGDPPLYAFYDAPASRAVEMTLKGEDYFDENAEILSQMDFLGTAIMYHRLCTFWYSLILVCRFLRGFTGQPRMAVIVQVMLAFSGTYCHFLIVFGFVFGTYALSGHYIFGEHLREWSTAGACISSLFQVMFGHFNYDDFHAVAPITAACWFSSFVVLGMQLLLGILTAAVLNAYGEVRSRLGEPGDSFVKQVGDYLGDSFWSRTYEGSLKTTPYEELLKILDVDGKPDPVRVRKLTRLRADRRLRNREELALASEDPPVTLQFLVDRGCDPHAAKRLLQKVTAWSQGISTTISPVNRMILMLGRHMNWVQGETEQVREKLRTVVYGATSGVERLDLKHAKCIEMARRVRSAQKMPPGWEAMYDDNGRRYLKHKESGLTSWHLPRTMF